MDTSNELQWANASKSTDVPRAVFVLETDERLLDDLSEAPRKPPPPAPHTKIKLGSTCGNGRREGSECYRNLRQTLKRYTSPIACGKKEETGLGAFYGRTTRPAQRCIVTKPDTRACGKEKETGLAAFYGQSSLPLDTDSYLIPPSQSVEEQRTHVGQHF